MPIKRKLPLFIVLLVAIPIVLFVAIYYPYVSRQMIQANKEKIQQVLDLECEHLHSFFVIRQLEAKNYATSQEVSHWTELEGEYDYTRLNQFFEQEEANIIDMNYVSTNMVQLVAPEVGRAYLIDQSGNSMYVYNTKAKMNLANLPISLTQCSMNL